MRTLIICATLVNPPSELSAFRLLTLSAKLEHFGRKYTTLIEVERAAQDIYYKYMKEKGLWDFIDDLIYPEWNEMGIKIAPPQIDRINLTNVYSLIKVIR